MKAVAYLASHESYRFSTFMQLLFSFGQGMGV